MSATALASAVRPRRPSWGVFLKRPAPWRVKYKREDAPEASQSGFETKKAALAWGNEQEAESRRILRGDPPSEVQAETEPDDITIDAWVDRWMEAQEVGTP